MHCQCHTCVCICKKFSSLTLAILRTWFTNESGILLALKDHKENGTESLNWWRLNSENADTYSSESRVHCLEGRSKAKEVGNYLYTSVPMRDTIETVFRTLVYVDQLSIFGAVSEVCEEFSTCQTRTERLVLAGQSDPLFEQASFLTIYHEMKHQLTWKVGFEWTPKLAPCWKSQPFICKVSMECKVELNLWTKSILTRRSEFLVDWTSWSQTWSTKSTTTTSRKLLKRRRNFLRWRRKYLLLQADQRLKQNREDLPLLVHLQELYLFVKEYGLILNQELNPITRTQLQKD